MYIFIQYTNKSFLSNQFGVQQIKKWTEVNKWTLPMLFVIISINYY